MAEKHPDDQASAEPETATAISVEVPDADTAQLAGAAIVRTEVAMMLRNRRSLL